MEFWGVPLTDWGTIIAMIFSISSLFISIMLFFRNRQRNRADIKIEFVKNDVKTGGDNIALDSYINLKNRGGLSTTIEKLDVIINDKLLKENPPLFETLIVDGELSTDETMSIPFDLEQDKTLGLMVEITTLPTENIDFFKKIEIKIKHTHGRSSKTHVFSH